MPTKKDFEQTAKILNERLDTCRVIIDGVVIPGLVYPEKQDAYNTIMYIAEEFADWFAEENSSFDRERFLRAVLA